MACSQFLPVCKRHQAGCAAATSPVVPELRLVVSSLRSRHWPCPRGLQASAGFNVPDATLVGRFSGDNQWPVWVIAKVIFDVGITAIGFQVSEAILATLLSRTVTLFACCGGLAAPGLTSAPEPARQALVPMVKMFPGYGHAVSLSTRNKHHVCPCLSLSSCRIGCIARDCGGVLFSGGEQL